MFEIRVTLRSVPGVLAVPHRSCPYTVNPPSLVVATVDFTITDTTATTATTTATTTETTTLLPPPPPVSTLTVIYPSPDAAPVEVTSISQVVTSYIPEATFCLGPALYFSSIAGGPFFNGSANVIQYVSGSSSCSVEYSTTTKIICATTLTGLASKVTVSDCDQEITFSSECGYSLEYPTPTAATTSFSAIITPAPTIRRLTTYWLAPWQSLTAGEAPSDVDVKVCKALDNGDMQCQRYQEVWEVVVVASTVTTSYPVTFSRIVSGPGALIFGSSTSFINSTTEFISLSKTLLLETEVTIESISTSTRPSSTVQTTEQYTSILTITRHLKYVPKSRPSSETSSSSSSTPESTTTVLVTSIITERRTSTVTRTRSRSRSGALTASA
ncbi:hypothetical protein BU25DRAFT_483106 [Macroventuria anomochaeta]|uniref:Uncharacterized protein n=1 Tax=Macroventuria anomochaeta TaxID=301207 RepID=A0ACB6RK14_9PLEO|nr:uncharacterized protein BU25DRAFT_483106 [Macroventuria anomochaeta]KAF2621309.1 hypothetical protein BU25DRAFT_483106 [Macroventuria anomochaeta]